jgi:NAD(P)-dependent dehydrogenase (short-subunit alcohol dehydrogenase family)
MVKTALVTGSAIGIGRAVAIDLAKKGFDVAFHYRTSKGEAEAAAAEARSYGINAIVLQADVTVPDQAQTLVDQAADQLGGLTVVVNNVGNYIYKPISQFSLEEWRYLLDTNLNATFMVTQAALPHLRSAGWGRVINFAFASALNVVAHKENGAYAISKTGIIIYSKSLALELIKDNITVNVVSPGAAENTVGMEEVLPLLPAQRPATLQEIANAVSFFASPDTTYITGQVLEVAGGFRL